MVKLIIFDWDDVFTLGAKDGYTKLLHDTIIELGVLLTPEEEHRRILSTWSKPHRDELANLLRERPELLDRACDLYEEKFFGGTFVQSLILVEGSVELLNRLQGQYLLAIATGAHPAVLKEQIMPKFSIPAVFVQIISAYDIADPLKQKPNPYMLETIMQTQGVEASETVYVGDAKSDVLMARSANVEPVVVLTGHLTRKEAEDLGVKEIIPTLVALPEVLSRIGAR